MLFIYIACMGLPVLYLAAMLPQYGWIMPVSPNAPQRSPQRSTWWPRYDQGSSAAMP